MSYILEALRKSERERRLGQVPSLPALDMEPPPKRPRWVVWLFALSLLLAVNAVFLTVVWLQSRGTSPPAPVTAEAPKPVPKATETVVAATPPPPNDLEQKLHELESRLAKIDQPASPPAPSATPRVDDSDAPPVSVRQPAKAPATPPSQGKFRREPASTATDAQPRTTDRAATRRKQAEDEGDASELPKEIQALKINVLAYSSDPAERFAVINMSRHVPGDRLPGGILLVDILPNGLALELDGERYRVNH